MISLADWLEIWIISQRRVRNIFKHRGSVTGLDFSPNGQSIAIASGRTVVIRGLRDGSSRVLDYNLPWSVRFSKDGVYVASGGNRHDSRIKILNVRMGRCVARYGGDVGAVRNLVFTPDGAGLLSASWDAMVIRWDVSWLKPTHIADGRKENVALTRNLTEISRFVGHKVRRLLSLFFPSYTPSYALFRTVLTPFLYHPMAIGLHQAHGIRVLESGMPILLRCSVSCMVLDKLCLLISVAWDIIWQSPIWRDK